MFEIRGTWQGDDVVVTWDRGTITGPPDFVDAVNYVRTNYVEGPMPLVFDHPDITRPGTAAQLIEFVLDDVTSSTGPEVDWTGCMDSFNPDALVKHYGPGNHPSGSPQEVHGSGAAKIYYHLTDNPKFELNPDIDPPENALSIFGDDPRKGIYLTDNPEHWINGYGYVRPFLVEIEVDESLTTSASTPGGFQGFLPAEEFAAAKIRRVIPLDEYAREYYHTSGWIEGTINPDIYYDTYPEDYAYTGPDIRDMSETATSKMIADAEQAWKDLGWADLEKHYGPGDHPGTGTPQTIHGAGLLNPATGKGTFKGKPVYKLLTNKDGSPWTYTADQDEPLYVSTPTGTKDITERYEEVLDTMEEVMEDHGLKASPRSLDANLNRLLDSAALRYKAHPELIEKDRFYELWHESLYELSQETGIDMTRVISAASAISPGLDAERNLHFAHDLARMVAAEDQISFEGDEASQLSAWLREKGQAIIEPRWNKKLHKLPEGAEDGDLRPPPKPDSPRHRQGQSLIEAADMIDSQGSFTVADLEPYPAAYVLHSYRKAHGPMGELNGEVADLYVPPPRIAVTSKMPSGFDIPKGFDNYEKGIAVLRGDLDPLSVLGDVKTRSFHNNILDPLNASGRNDVTVDYHTINFTTSSFGADQNTTLTGTPALEGVNLGVRPLMADAIRRAASRYAKVFPDGHVPSRIQEIAWAEWRRGLTTKPKLYWTSFDGKVHSSLPYTGKGIWRQEEQA